MWLKDINELCIYKTRYINILTNNTSTNEERDDLEEIREPKFALNHQDCQEFLNVKALYIETLKLQGDAKEEILNLKYFHLKLQPFRNLKKLIYQQMAVTDEDLQVIGQNCPQLRSLHLIKCFCVHFEDLLPGVNIKIDSISDMVQLQELEIQPEKPPGTVRYLKLEYIQQLLSRITKLNYLNLKNFTILCEDVNKLNRTYRPVQSWCLDFLNIGLITWEFWCTFTGFLKCCPKLRHLIIEIPRDTKIVVDFKIIDILSKYCKNLKILTLQECLLNVADFCALQGLEELTLLSCQGLTFNNLQQILGGLKLKTFNLFNTRVLDGHNYIYVSDTLESMTIDTLHSSEISEMFQKTLNNLSGLQTLNWLRGDINHGWILNKCPRLQQLHITNYFHLTRFVLNLKSLKELTISSCVGLSWSVLQLLLFNSGLKSLKICNTEAIIDDSRKSGTFSQMLTTLELLTLPQEIFLKDLQFWLELLTVNEKLGLMLYGRAEDVLNVRLLYFLLASDIVQQRWKRIKICGFPLEFENFQKSTILREIVRSRLNTHHFKARRKPFTLEL